MLGRGRRNVVAAGRSSRIALVLGQGERLPFPDSTFDALTFTYLLRYVADPAATIAELARVLRPGGTMASLEFAVPPNRFWRAWWWLYTRAVLPVAGASARRAGMVRRRTLPRSQHHRALSSASRSPRTSPRGRTPVWPTSGCAG